MTAEEGVRSSAARRGSPLAGMRVLDLSQQLPGPYATLLLVSLGASITKIEPPSGDAARHLDPPMFDTVNRGKEPRTLDLKLAGDRKTLHSLIAEHDVLIEGFRPGVAHKLGFDYATAAALNPALVYCSISGFGQHGPMARHPSHDLTLQAMAGALPDGVEVDRIGVPWVDLGTATTAAFAITAHWHQGQGAYLDLAMVDTALAWAAVKPGAVNVPEATYGSFATADDEWMTIALLEDSMWRRLCGALGWQDLIGDPGFSTYRARRGRVPQIRARLAEAFATRTCAELVALGDEFDLPLMPTRPAAGSPARKQIEARWNPRAADFLCVPLPPTQRSQP